MLASARIRIEASSKFVLWNYHSAAEPQILCQYLLTSVSLIQKIIIINILETFTGAFYIKIMRFASFFRVQIHSWNANVEPCNPLHQGDEQSDTKMFLLVIPFLYYSTCWSSGGKEENCGGEGGDEENRSVLNNQENSFLYLIYVAIIFIYYRLLGWLLGVFVSLWLFYILSWKVWCNVGYCVVLSNSIWHPVSMLCFDNSNCTTCFNLTSRWCPFIRKLTILPVFPMYTCPQE